MVELPIVARYYESVSRDLYAKGMHSTDLRVIEEDSTTESFMYTP